MSSFGSGVWRHTRGGGHPSRRRLRVRSSMPCLEATRPVAAGAAATTLPKGGGAIVVHAYPKEGPCEGALCADHPSVASRILR